MSTSAPPPPPKPPTPQPPTAPVDPWSHVAKAYLRNIAPGFKPAVERLCRYAAIKRDEKVLDIGCGPGTASFAAVHMGAEVTGVDYSPEMIAIAKDIAGSKREYTFLEGDMHKLPVEDGKFDVVISSFGVIMATGPTKVVAEMARVLVPGGRIALLVWPRSGALGRYYDLLDKHIPQEPGAVDHFRWGDINVVRGWLAKEFDAVASADLEVPFTAKNQAAAWDALKVSTARVAPAYEQLAPEAKAALDKEMAELFRSYKKPDGTVSWPRKALMIRATKHIEVVPKSDTVFRSVIAVLGGFLATVITQGIISGVTASAMMKGPTAPPTQTYLITNVVVALAAAGLGGWLTAKLAPNQPWKHVGGLAGALVVKGLLSGFTTAGLPLWFKLAVAAVGLVGAGIGAVVMIGRPGKT